nr:Zgc:112338 [Danio rerio]
MAAGAEAPDSWYLALLGFAEHFRTSSPPKIRLCVHCLQAVFQFKPPQRVEARTHLQLGSVLYHHTHTHTHAQTDRRGLVFSSVPARLLCSSVQTLALFF